MAGANVFFFFNCTKIPIAFMWVVTLKVHFNQHWKWNFELYTGSSVSWPRPTRSRPRAALCGGSRLPPSAQKQSPVAYCSAYCSAFHKQEHLYLPWKLNVTSDSGRRGSTFPVTLWGAVLILITVVVGKYYEVILNKHSAFRRAALFAIFLICLSAWKNNMQYLQLLLY